MHEEPGTAVVSGGTGALGSVIVRCLRKRGLSVAVPVRGESRPGGEDGVFYAPADLTSETSVREFYAAAGTSCGPLKILVNAAGGYVGGVPVDEVRTEDWDAALAMNLTTCFLMSREALRIMKNAGWGRIINIAAMTALAPEAGKAPYAIAKRGVITLTETIAAEIRGTGITVNAIAPGVIRTDANRSWMTKEMEAKSVPPEEIAALVSFLCSEDARSISGNTIMVSRGL